MTMAKALLFFLLFQTGSVKAEEKNVLDFDADVIEGEKKKPDLLLQLGSDYENLDSLVYFRNDFTDFMQKGLSRFKKLKTGPGKK